LITNASRLSDFFCYFFLRAEDCAEGEVIRNPYKFNYLLQKVVYQTATIVIV
jgi:hypothetical protein